MSFHSVKNADDEVLREFNNVQYLRIFSANSRRILESFIEAFNFRFVNEDASSKTEATWNKNSIILNLNAAPANRTWSLYVLEPSNVRIWNASIIIRDLGFSFLLNSCR